MLKQTVSAVTIYFSFSTDNIQANDVSDPVALTVVNLGDKVTLNCNASEKDFAFFHWYKQPLGQMVQTVASQILGKETMSVKFKDSRFKATSKSSQYFLTITNVSKEDEATYLCHSGTTFSHKFINATFLVVYGKIWFRPCLWDLFFCFIF